ncbi:hypothetical protein B0H19DRAFT_1386047, partial [Mycena capillaripes]
ATSSSCPPHAPRFALASPRGCIVHSHPISSLSPWGGARRCYSADRKRRRRKRRRRAAPRPAAVCPGCVPWVCSCTGDAPVAHGVGRGLDVLLWGVQGNDVRRSVPVAVAIREAAVDTCCTCDAAAAAWRSGFLTTQCAAQCTSNPRAA